MFGAADIRLSPLRSQKFPAGRVGRERSSPLVLAPSNRIKLERLNTSACDVDSFQLRVLSFRSDENRNVGVGVFPEREEILIGCLGFRGVALHGVGAGEAEMRECSGRTIPQQPAMVENFLELGSGERPCCALK